MPKYVFEHGLRVPQHLVVPIAQYPKSPLHQKGAAVLVVFPCRRVLSAVHFHHQAGIEAGEINDVGANRVLPAKTPTAELPPPQAAPEPTFGIR
jgi:hypothetical protein